MRCSARNLKSIGRKTTKTGGSDPTFSAFGCPKSSWGRSRPLQHFDNVVRLIHSITFREQAEIWLEQMKNRKWKPVAPSTLTAWACCLENWLNPHIGHMPLENIRNLALKNLGITMVEGGLGE
ncbi:MAG: hypothetical protein WBS17_10385 [Candidatus Acidiferrales bacterium]